MKQDELLKELKKQLEYDWGKPCKDYADGCGVCRIWFAYKILHQSYGLYSHLTPDFPALKRSRKEKSNLKNTSS